MVAVARVVTDPISPGAIAEVELVEAGYGIPDGDERCIADVAPERVRWLWPGRVPFGKVVLLDGDPGLGKSTLMLDLAARLSTGSVMPDGHRPDGKVGTLVMSAEDGAGDTIRPRLQAAAADLRRVFIFDRVTDHDDRNDEYFVRPVELPGDLPRIQRIVTDHDLGLVIIDPLVAFLGAKTDSHRDQDVRRVLYPLAQMAETTGCAVVCLRHLNKAPGANPLYRGGGSIGFIGAARLGLLVAPDPNDAERRVLAVAKSNLAVIPDSLAFRLCPDELREVAYIGWEGPVASTAADLLRVEKPTGGSGGEREEAAEFLEDLLRDGPLPARAVRDAAAANCIAWRTVERAKRELGVVSYQPSGALHPGWHWALPEGSGRRHTATQDGDGLTSDRPVCDVPEIGSDQHRLSDRHPPATESGGGVTSNGLGDPIQSEHLVSPNLKTAAADGATVIRRPGVRSPLGRAAPLAALRPTSRLAPGSGSAGACSPAADRRGR